METNTFDKSDLSSYYGIDVFFSFFFFGVIFSLVSFKCRENKGVWSR